MAYAGAYSWFEVQKVVLWATDPCKESLLVYGMPGQIFRFPGEDDPCVVTGAGTLAIRKATDDLGVDAMPMLRRAGNRRFSGER